MNLTGFLNDVRFGLRTFVRHPLYAGAAIGSLAFGIGACVVMYVPARRAMKVDPLTALRED